jgi:hypothetical protein
MRIIENILLKNDLLEESKRAENIKALCKQIEYYLSNNAELAECLSLIPVLDLVMPALKELGYQQEDLKQKGFLLTIKDFYEATTKFCSLAENDAIIYNSRLKRLHEAYIVFIRNYVQGLVENQQAKAEMVAHFSHTLQEYYLNDTSTHKKIPRDLRTQIAKLLEDEIESLNIQWLSQAISESKEKELNELFTARLLVDRHNNKLPSRIKEKLETEEVSANSSALNGNNTVERLLNQFRQKRLGAEVQAMIKTALAKAITERVDSGELTVHTKLGAAYKLTKKSEIRGKHFIIPTMIENWQKGRFDADASKDLEDIAVKVIKQKIQDKEAGLTQQFDRLAVEIFLEKICSKKYSDEFIDIVRLYTENIVKEVILSKAEASYSICREEIFKQAMVALHELWIGKKLSPEKNVFIQDTVFASMRELDEKVQKYIWRNKIVVQNSETQEEVIGLRAELAEVHETLNQFRELLKKLMMDKQSEGIIGTPSQEPARALNSEDEHQLSKPQEMPASNHSHRFF